MRLATALVAAVAVPGVLGFVLGAVTDRERPGGDQVVVAASNLAVHVPSDWKRARPVRIPGLVLAHAVALGPGGRTNAGGLLFGKALGASGPLPQALRGRLAGSPRVEVVTLGNTDGYRLTDVHVSGFDRRLVLLAVPGQDSAAVVACYAAPDAAALLRRCQQIAATLEVYEGFVSGDLHPSTPYARRVADALSALDARRSPGREALARSNGRNAQRRAALRLRQAYAASATQLRGAVPPQAAEVAHAELLSALQRAGAVYGALAHEADADSAGRWSAARVALTRNEEAVNAALGDLMLLGYAGRGSA